MATTDYSFQFGKFNYICNNVMLTLCPLVGTDDGIEPVCYSRNVRLAETLLFQPCKCLFLLCLLYLRHCCFCWKRGWSFLFAYSCTQFIWHSMTTLKPKNQFFPENKREEKGDKAMDHIILTEWTFFSFLSILMLSANNSNAHYPLDRLDHDGHYDLSYPVKVHCCR